MGRGTLDHQHATAIETDSLDAERQYQAMPKATISPDGKLIIFSSNMNDRDGRVDVFAVEVPTR